MILSDFHMHTVYCDGQNTPEEMIVSAIKKGMKAIGITVHSHTHFDIQCCIAKDRDSDFIREIHSLKEKYKDKISVYAGIEQDVFSDYPANGYDYIIGSVHYVKKGEKYLSVDQDISLFSEYAQEYYNGDFYAMAEDYFDLVSDVCLKTKCDIIGHFDLISKFNQGNRFFDEQNHRYVTAYKNAIDKLIKYNIPFEVNTGAISRGYKSTPYPSYEIMDYIHKLGGRFVMSGDSHSSENLCYEFDKWEKVLKQAGYDVVEFKM